MTIKHIKIEEETLKELNKAKSKILNKNPSIKNLTDNSTLFLCLKEYNKEKREK
jgi:hypothetical protein